MRRPPEQEHQIQVALAHHLVGQVPAIAPAGEADRWAKAHGQSLRWTARIARTRASLPARVPAASGALLPLGRRPRPGVRGGESRPAIVAGGGLGGGVQLGPEAAAGANEPLAGRRRADPQDDGGLVGAQAVPGDQGEQLPVVGSQPAESVPNGDGVVGRGRRFAMAVLQVVAQPVRQRAAPGLAAAVVGERPPGDPEQPGCRLPVVSR
jgi:hypothetical protein